MHCHVLCGLILGHGTWTISVFLIHLHAAEDHKFLIFLSHKRPWPPTCCDAVGGKVHPIFMEQWFFQPWHQWRPVGDSSVNAGRHACH